jgi:hypothetical protein
MDPRNGGDFLFVGLTRRRPGYLRCFSFFEPLEAHLENSSGTLEEGASCFLWPYLWQAGRSVLKSVV